MRHRISTPLVRNVTASSYQPAALSARQTYYWKVVAKNSSASTSSATWSFTTASAGPTQSCDINGDGVLNINDVQREINAVLGLVPCTVDPDGDGRCSVTDVQRVITAVLGGSCRLGP